MKTLRLAVPLILALWWVSPAFAQTWSSYSDEEELRGKMVVDVGSLSERSTVRSDFYDDPISKEVKWLQFRGAKTYCLDARYSYGYGAKLLLADKNEQLYVATFTHSTFSGIKVEVELAFLIQCP